ncbi:hypothetical protein CEUSTIGMA_g6112.t1 [Chlamydomonas eustigma]|uniref:Uncharacterized protein n=1 Tax=Chlamydomonas eustigma TaxID=1157962 RepID=A0A250X6F9_9CHLO|nr:hypothetical protein CEUSTIGMA_g6112.t1 [Chlamydomonas eustigma]|eukprot:GAX78674.1 hypothetical protein CEUSTIGMA_g6112.t1 [Chlamydomonas eustigma]
MLEALLLRYINAQDIQQAHELIKMGAKFYRRILNFKNFRLSDQTAEIIGAALGDCLKSLDLSPSNEKGQLTEKGVRAIAAGLSKCTSLVELDLSYHQQIGEDGVHALTSALKGKNCNTSLTTLKLVKCGIDDEGAAELGELLKVNESLVKIDIGANDDIKEKGAQALMTSLHGNMTLRCLDLHAVDLGHKGSWTALGLMIHANKGLEILVLNHCGLTQTAMEQVGSGLSNNKTLRLLDLSNNHLIGGKGAVALSVFLPQNSGLVELSLRDCNIDIEGGLALKEVLHTNVGLVHLDIGSNLVKRNDWEEMVKHDSTIKALVSVDIPSSKPSSAAAIPWIPRVLSNGGARREFLTSLTSSGHLLLQSPTGASKGLVGDFLPIAGSSEDVMQAMQRASILKTGLSTIAPQNQHSIFTPGSRIGLLIGSGADGEESGSRMLQNSVSQSDWRTKSLRIASMPIIRNVDPLMSPTSATSASLLAGKSANSSSTTATPLISIKRLDASESTKALNGAGKKTASAAVTSEMIGATAVKGNNKGSNMVTPLPAVAGAVKSKQGLSKSAEQVVAAGVISSRVLSPSSGSKKHSLPSSKAGRVIKKISSIAEEDAAVATTAAVVRVLPSSVKVK